MHQAGLYPKSAGGEFSVSELGKRLAQVRHDLIDLGAAFALVGGFAMSVHARARLTKDVDLAVAVTDDEEAEGLVRALHQRGYRVRAMVEQEDTGRMSTVRLSLPGSDSDLPEVDLLFASSGIETEVVQGAQEHLLSEVGTMPVARREHLIAMKTLSASEHRDHDVRDLIVLLSEASPRELELARQALALIKERGFDRGKDLEAELERFARKAR